MLKFTEVDQNTDEWMALRAGKLTCSKLGVVMANFGKAFGDPAKRYAIDIAIGRVTGRAPEGGFNNAHMDRGHEQEPLARAAYEDLSFTDVDLGGFFCSDKIGCSPDGLVNEDGAIEIKSVIPSVHYDYIRKGGVPASYKWQVCGNLYYTGRDWIDFVSYCQDYPESGQLYVCRKERGDYANEFKMIGSRVAEFLSLVDECEANIRSHNYG